MMDTEKNMNPELQDTTTAYPDTVTTPGSDFSALLMLLRLLFGMKKFHQKPEQELKIKPQITWSPNIYTKDEQLNPMNSKPTYEEDSNLSKAIAEREIPQSLTFYQNMLQKRYRRQAGKDQKEESICEFNSPSNSGKLKGKFAPGSKVVISCRPTKVDDRMTFTMPQSTMFSLQTDNRWYLPYRGFRLVINSFNTTRGREIVVRPAPIKPGPTLVLSIHSLEKELKDYKKKKRKITTTVKPVEFRLLDEQENACHDIVNANILKIPKSFKFIEEWTLTAGFEPGSKIFMRGTAINKFVGIFFRIYSKSTGTGLYIKNYWKERGNFLTVSKMLQDMDPLKLLGPSPIQHGKQYFFSIRHLEHSFKICLNDEEYTIQREDRSAQMDTFAVFNAEGIEAIYYHGDK